MGSRSRDRGGGGECWGPGGRTFVTPLRYTNCSSGLQHCELGVWGEGSEKCFFFFGAWLNSPFGSEHFQYTPSGQNLATLVATLKNGCVLWLHDPNASQGQAQVHRPTEKTATPNWRRFDGQAGEGGGGGAVGC